MEKIKGTLVYHLPFERNQNISPEITLVVRRKSEPSLGCPDLWIAGLSVCSKKDQFSKALGRLKANSILEGSPIAGKTVNELLRKVQTKLSIINGVHPGTISEETIKNMLSLTDKLNSMRVE